MDVAVQSSLAPPPVKVLRSSHGSEGGNSLLNGSRRAHDHCSSGDAVACMISAALLACNPQPLAPCTYSPNSRSQTCHALALVYCLRCIVFITFLSYLTLFYFFPLRYHFRSTHCVFVVELRNSRLVPFPCMLATDASHKNSVSLRLIYALNSS